MLVIESIHHIAVCVTDLERAERFYTDVLGLTKLRRPAFDFGGAWYALGGGQQLHLIVHDETRTLRGTTDIDARDGHVAIRVRSYRDTVAHLQSHGIACLDKPYNLTPWPQVYVTDPDGNIIEFNAERLD